MRGQHGVTAAVGKSEHIVLGNFVAKSNATRAQNAALVVERNSRAELHRFRLLNLVCEKVGAARAALNAAHLEAALSGAGETAENEWMVTGEVRQLSIGA